MINVTASLQIRNGIYQAVLSYKKDNKWETKWKSTKIQAIKGNKKKAETKKEEIRQKFQEEINNDNIEDEDMLFIDYMKHWLKIIKPNVEETTYNGYDGIINGRMTDYFKDKDITLQNIKPKHIQEFYQHLLQNGLSGNTVKHYHANIRKALQSAMKTDICGNIIRPDYITETFLKLLKKKKLKIIRFHDLRHSVASILLKNGANMKEIQAWLGHSNYNTTANLYAHLDTSSINDVGKVITSVFKTKKEVVNA